jgi:hypothetical protein
MRRITVFLPVGTDEEIQAAASVREWLQTEVAGFSTSLLDPPVFDGFWRNTSGKWVLELTSLLVLDVPLGDELRAFIRLLNAEISYRYARFGSAQDAAGISVSDLVLTTY